jgi:tRNA (uracil-5-)-methyltransferase
MPLSNVKPQHYDQLLAAKRAEVESLMSDFELPAATVVSSPTTGFRMRAEFRMWHDGDALDYVMFRPGAPRDPVPIQEFPIACERIQALMPALREHLQHNTTLRHKLFQVEFLSTLAGDTLVTLIYHRRLDADWEREAQAIQTELNIVIVGRSRKQKVVFERDYVTEQLPIAGQRFEYRQYEQAFTQPNARVNIAMIEWACKQAEQCSGDLLELYCGNVNFSLPMAHHFEQVFATELSKTSIKAARHNIAANRTENVQMIRLSAEEVSAAMAGEREFRRLKELPKPLGGYALNTVFVDPPRAGLDEATLNMVAGFERIIYISCNPHTLAANLRTLCTSHSAEGFALFDQFPYTAHMECGVLLQRRNT